ncbi:BCCT family transporter [Facklamia sp. P12945]|uniref:BCCT family transporter n=1 Tax=unclassified Facklamia TaxID=2622293 RepID=UPI003D175989
MKKLKEISVYHASLITSFLLVILGIFIPNELSVGTQILKDQVANNFGWLYLLLIPLILLVCIYFILSPLGQIRLGEPDSKPEYSTTSWVAMMFSAGMGIGLVFYGAAEPLSHFAISTPIAPAGSQEALADAFRFTFFHWGIHGWAIYGVVALALAYFGFRKQENYLLSHTLKPLLGNKATGWIGTVVDTITIVATVIGVATTIGFGAAQINGGLNYLFNISISNSVQIIIIIITTILFILSAISGLGKGVKILSNLNLLLAGCLLAIVAIVGPTVGVLNTFTESLGNYLQNFIEMSFRSAAFDRDKREWINTWTLFYWAWWTSWSPFVGIFIARISRGRTIREFLTVVLLLPTLLSFIWFSTFGTLAANVQMNIADLTAFEPEQLLFATFNYYPLSGLLSLVAIILVVSFFITSADSATFVLAMLSEEGNIKPNNRTKITWGFTLSIIAVVLLLSGGLLAIQNVLIIVSLPFVFILILVILSLIKELNHEQREMGLTITPDRLPNSNDPFKSYED